MPRGSSRKKGKKRKINLNRNTILLIIISLVVVSVVVGGFMSYSVLQGESVGPGDNTSFQVVDFVGQEETSNATGDIYAPKVDVKGETSQYFNISENFEIIRDDVVLSEVEVDVTKYKEISDYLWIKVNGENGYEEDWHVITTSNNAFYTIEVYKLSNSVTFYNLNQTYDKGVPEREGEYTLYIQSPSGKCQPPLYNPSDDVNRSFSFRGVSRYTEVFGFEFVATGDFELESDEYEITTFVDEDEDKGYLLFTQPIGNGEFDYELTLDSGVSITSLTAKRFKVPDWNTEGISTIKTY